MPSVSAAASWVESLKMPMRDIRKKYTISDLVLLAWDSKQKAYNMSVQFKQPNNKDGPTIVRDGQRLSGLNAKIRETETHYEMPPELNNGVAIPKHFFNERGDIDLRRVSGNEAANYMRALGIDVPPVFRT